MTSRAEPSMQPLVALRQANEARFAGAAMKRDLRSRCYPAACERAAELLERSDRSIAHLQVGKLLTAIPYVQAIRAEGILRRAGLMRSVAGRRVDRLSSNERRALAAALRVQAQEAS